jgi:hypothetical protein
MEPTHETVCKELLLDLICYEKSRGRLSPEMEYLLEKHLERCRSCRRDILDFRKLLQINEPVPNFG